MTKRFIVLLTQQNEINERNVFYQTVHFQPKQDATEAGCVVVRNNSKQVLTGSYYNRLIHQNTRNCLLMRSLLSPHSFNLCKNRLHAGEARTYGNKPTNAVLDTAIICGKKHANSCKRITTKLT